MTVWKTEKYREIILFSEFGNIAGDKINIPNQLYWDTKMFIQVFL